MLKPRLSNDIQSESASARNRMETARVRRRQVDPKGLRLSLLAMLAAAQPAIAAAGNKITDYSAYPEMSQERTLPIIAAGLRDNLLDAGSVTNFAACYPPVKVKFKDGKSVRWTVMLSLNSKNSFGGYTGPQRVAAVFYADKPVTIFPSGMPMSAKLLSTCTRIPDAQIRQLIQGE